MTSIPSVGQPLDVLGRVVRAAGFQFIASQPTYGSVQMDPATGNFRYFRPFGKMSGIDSFTFYATDGQLPLERQRS